MTEKEKRDDDIRFLSAEIYEMAIAFNVDEPTNQGFIVADIKGDTRAFYPLEFCELSFIAQGIKADNAKFENGKVDLNKQAKIFVKFKTNITQAIERYKRFAEDYPNLKKQDFDSFMRQVDTAINESKLNVEIKLLNSQVKANESAIEANRISKITNIYIAIFTFIAAEYYCYEFLRNYISDLNQCKSKIINLSLFAVALLGIIGYLRIQKQPQPSNKVRKS